jgi:hypothetical protein
MQMKRVMMTGMCTAIDRLVQGVQHDREKYALYPAHVSNKSEIIREFSIARNLGNYLITEGAFLALGQCDVTYVPFWLIVEKFADREYIETLQRDYECCVFVTANILHADFELKSELRFFQSWTKPLVFMSVGIQKLTDLSGDLPAHTKALVDIFKRDNVQTFTRGPLTSGFLNDQGVKNVVDSCCPSAFAFPEGILKSIGRVSSILDQPHDDIWINGYLGISASTVEDISQLSKVSKKISYVFQDEPLLFGTLDAKTDETKVFNDYCNSFEADAIADVAAENIEFLAFFSPDVWRARVCSASFSVGRRFHGNLAAMQVGRPAIFVAHDDRVQDMATAIGLPWLSAQDWVGSPHRMDAIKAVAQSYDAEKASAAYLQKLASFGAALQQLGLQAAPAG